MKRVVLAILLVAAFAAMVAPVAVAGQAGPAPAEKAAPPADPPVPPADPPIPPPPAEPAMPMPARPADPHAPAAVTVSPVEPMLAVVLPMKGSYMQHEEAFGRLGAILGSTGMIPVGPPFGRYFDDSPDAMPEDELTWEVGFPLGQKAQVAPPFEVKEIPGGLMAVTVQEGPYEGSAMEAFTTVMGWVPANGYRPTGAPIALFAGGPMDPKTEVRLPVEKVQ